MQNTEPENKVVHVAVAVIQRSDGSVFVARRPTDKHMGGMWEFPGGKVEAGETLHEAMKRELLEELGVETETVAPVIQIQHEYPEKTVLLDVWQVRIIAGEPHGAEGQPVCWRPVNELRDEDFPPANRPIISALKLPSRYLITGRFSDESDLRVRLEHALKAGTQLICFRAPWLSNESYHDLCERIVAPLCAEYGARLLVKGGLNALHEHVTQDVAGMHLTSAELEQLLVSDVLDKQYLYAASCHNLQQLQLAAERGVDFVTLSPVKKTTSHPGCDLLGESEATKLTLKATVPVYWLGGMSEGDLSAAQSAGAQGVAAITAFWEG
ncbi:Nudix family hydrolase [Spongorhabdus nitratireducens]